MDLEALAIIGGGAILLFFLIVPMVLWIRRRSDGATTDRPAVSKFGLCLMVLQVLLMLAAAVVAKFVSGLAGVGLLALSFVVPWIVGEVFKRRGYELYVSQPNNSLQRDRGV